MKTNRLSGTRSPVKSIDTSAAQMGALILLSLCPITLQATTFSDADWSGLGSGIGGPVYALAVKGTDLYAGGAFTNAGGVSANNLAKWNGSNWSGLGSGLDGPVFGLVVSGTDLYAGGYFTNAGGISANRIAKWNGSAWAPLGSGMDGPVYAVTAYANTIYAGGYFTYADGAVVNNVAKWQGAWMGLRNPGPDGLVPGVVGGSVYALAQLTGGIGVAGDFSSAGGYPATYCIATWNNFSWNAVDSGLAGPIRALAQTAGTAFYVGGNFNVLRNNTTLQNIARWNGTAWESLVYWRYAPNGTVYALAMNGTDLYVGGGFTTAVLMSFNRILCYSDTTHQWSAIGSGVNSDVRALAVDGSGNLFVGGDFTIAGTNSASHIARLNLAGTVSGGILVGASFSPSSGFSCIFSNGTIGKNYRIQTRSSLENDSWSDLTNFNYTGPITIIDPASTGKVSSLYRAVSP